MFAKLQKFFGEVRAELLKATWPWDPKEKGVRKYKQLIDSTIVVLVATLLLAAYVALADLSMQSVMKALTTGFDKKVDIQAPAIPNPSEDA